MFEFSSYSTLGAKPVEEDEKKPSRVAFSNHNRYSQHLYSRISLPEIDDIIRDEIPNLIVKNNAKNGTKLFLNRCHRFVDALPSLIVI